MTAVGASGSCASACSTPATLAADTESRPDVGSSRRSTSGRATTVCPLVLQIPQDELTSLTELPPGAERLTASKYVTELREIWNAMTKEERIEATKDAVEEVRQMRAARENSVHNVPIAAFHDVRANVRSVEQEVSPRLISLGMLY